MTPEKRFETKLKNYLTGHGWWFVKYWAGSSFTKEGIPDILACCNGVFVAIEVKAQNGRPSMLQLVTLRDIRSAGGIGVLLYPDQFDRFVSFINHDPGSHSWYMENIALQVQWFDKLK